MFRASTADISLINSISLPGPPIFPPLCLLESQADTLKHEPCRLLGNAQGSAKFVRTDTVLAVDQHPHCRHPLIESKRGILKDRPDLDRELFLAALAEPNQARLDERVLIVTAARAADTLPSGQRRLTAYTKARSGSQK